LTGLADNDHPQYRLIDDKSPISAQAFYVISDGEVATQNWINTPGNVDHGALGGLADDDHTQYLLIDGTRPMTGRLEIIPGTRFTPGIAFDNDSGTGIYREGTRTIGFALGQLKRAVLGKDGLWVDDKVKAEAFYVASGGELSNEGIVTDNGHIKANLIAGDIGNEGSSISVGGAAFTSQLKISEIGNGEANLHLHRHSTSGSNVIIGSLSRSSDASHGNVANDDILMAIYASGWVDSTYEVASRIDFAVDGTPSAGICPGEIVFRVNKGADTGIVPPVAMRISSDHHVRMNNTLSVKNAVTAEAFYLKTGGEVRAWDVNDSQFYVSKDGDGTSIINLKHDFLGKHITLQNPDRNEDITWFVAEEDMTVVGMDSFLRTQDSGFYPSVKFSIRFGSGIPTTPNGTELTTGGWQIGFYPGHPYLTENPLRRASFTNPNISGGDWVWLHTGDIGEGNGIEEELHVSLKLRKT